MTDLPPEIDDYVILKVPHNIDPDDPGARLAMDRMAEHQVMRQYERPPRALLLDQIDWLVTSDWQEVERFQPAHDCAECQAGNARAIAFLKEHPEERLALGNMHYVEIW